MSREGQRVTPTQIKVWKEENGLVEEAIIDAVESKYPNRFDKKDKIVHQAILDVWHLTDEGQSVAEGDIMDYIDKQFKSDKLYRYDLLAPHEREVKYAFYSMCIDMYCEVSTSNKPIAAYLKDQPAYTEEMQQILSATYPTQADLCKHINEEYEQTTINFPRDYRNGNRLYATAKVDNEGIYISKDNYTSSRTSQTSSTKRREDASSGSGCMVALIVPIVIAIILLW